MIYYISQYFQIVSERIIPALGGALLRELLSNNRNVKNTEVLSSYPGGSGIFCTLFIYQ